MELGVEGEVGEVEEWTSVYTEGKKERKKGRRRDGELDRFLKSLRSWPFEPSMKQIFSLSLQERRLCTHTANPPSHSFFKTFLGAKNLSSISRWISSFVGSRSRESSARRAAGSLGGWESCSLSVEEEAIVS